MVLDSYRGRGQSVLEPIARRLAPGGADRLTWASLVAAGAAGVCYTWASPASPGFLVLGALFVLANGLFDALDGMVARLTGSASPAGDFLDHALDRYADLFIIGGLAASAFGGYTWGFFAITGVFLTSYMGTQAAAVGLHRDYGGLLGRADRLVLLSLVPLMQAVFVAAGLPVAFAVPRLFGPSGAVIGVTLIEALLFLFALLGHLTALQRFVRARFALLAREGKLEGPSASSGATARETSGTARASDSKKGDPPDSQSREPPR